MLWIRYITRKHGKPCVRISKSSTNFILLLTDEQYWFQNYHLILFSPELMSNLDTNIQKYLIPNRAIGKVNKETRYENFYRDNLSNGNSMINDISVVIANIKQYLSYALKKLL